MQQLISFVVIFVGVSIDPNTAQDRIAELLERASHQSRSSPQWAKLMMQADDEAAKLVRPATNRSADYRSIRINENNLNFRTNGISGVEDYQHDLLKQEAVWQSGTRDGAVALNRLLQGQCGIVGNELTPYYKTVLDIVTAPSWMKLNDPGLTRIRAEAYETWWSLSLEEHTEDYTQGAGEARQQAMAAYQQLLRLDANDTEAKRSLLELKAGQDTHQRKWFCVGD